MALSGPACTWYQDSFPGRNECQSPQSAQVLLVFLNQPVNIEGIKGLGVVVRQTGLPSQILSFVACPFIVCKLSVCGPVKPAELWPLFPGPDWPFHPGANNIRVEVEPVTKTEAPRADLMDAITSMYLSRYWTPSMKT